MAETNYIPGTCGVCGKRLDDPSDMLLSADCGGECRMCMAVVFGDPGEAKACILGLASQRSTLLKAMTNLVSWAENVGSFDVDDPVFHATLNEARSAIAKAEGR